MDEPGNREELDSRPRFGSVLKRLRLAAGLTHEALAERAGLGARTLSDLERGVSRAPRADTLALLIDALRPTPEQRAELERAARHLPEPVSVTPAPATSTLPLQLTSFVGREDEARSMRDVLVRSDVRLVTLVGPGGVGKTRLSLHVAAQLGERFRDGVRLVDLAPVADASGVAPAVGRVLGAPEGRAVTPEHLIALIGDKTLLVLLDNMEHVLDAAPLVADLLRGCPGLTALATSRAPLRISGEQEFPRRTAAGARSGALAASGGAGGCSAACGSSSSARRGSRPDFALTDENAAADRRDLRPPRRPPAGDRAGRRPDQHAAARAPAGTACDDDGARPATADGGPRDAPARQQTMRDAIAWSHDLLRRPSKPSSAASPSSPAASRWRRPKR